MMRFRQCGLCLVAGALLVVLSASAEPAYELIDIGDSQFNGSSAVAINSHGQIVGHGWVNGSSAYDSFVWSEEDGLTILPEPFAATLATDINDLGQIVGVSGPGPYNTHSDTVLWQPDGSYQLLGIPKAQETNSFSSPGINNLGQVASYGGQYRNSSWHPRPYVWSPDGTVTWLPYLHNYGAAALAINDTGQIGGWARLSNINLNHAALWLDGQLVAHAALGGGRANVIAINQNGLMCGSAVPGNDNYLYPMVWDGTTMLNLGSLGGHGGLAYGINDLGQVVGQTYYASGGTTTAFIWQDGVMTDLRTLVDMPAGYTLVSANAINNDGLIAAYVYRPDGAHAMLLKPIKTNEPPVANAGPDQFVEQTSPQGADVTLDGSGSSDPDGDALTYTWTVNGAVIAGPTQDPVVTVSLAPAHYSIVLTVDDGNGGTDSDDEQVIVADTTPPEIQSVTASPDVLWSPNHQMVDVAISVAASDVADPNPTCSILSVASNEDDNGKGDGNTTDDWVVTGNLTLQLRAERSGNGDGRTYTITVQCVDATGNASQATVTVSVPKSQGDAGGKGKGGR